MSTHAALRPAGESFRTALARFFERIDKAARDLKAENARKRLLLRVQMLTPAQREELSVARYQRRAAAERAKGSRQVAEHGARVRREMAADHVHLAVMLSRRVR